MKIKTRNYIITLSLAGIVLALIFLSVWLDLKKTSAGKGTENPSQPITRYQPQVPAPSKAPFSVSLKFSGKFPADISQGVPLLTAQVQNNTASNAFVQLSHISLKKTDFILKGPGKASVAAVFTVIPYELTEGMGDSIMLKPGMSKNLEYRISDYFIMYPGVSDLSIEFAPGAFQAGPQSNPAAVSAVLRLPSITKGRSIPSLFTGGGDIAPKSVAFVNEAPISEGEFLESLKEIHGWELLQKLIAEKVVWQELKKQNIKITQSDIDYAIGIERLDFTDKAPGVPFETYLETAGMTLAELSSSKGFLLRVAVRKYLLSIADEPEENDLMKFFNRKYHWYGREEMIRAQKIVVRPETKNGKITEGKAREDALNTLLTIRSEITEGKIEFDKAVAGLSQDVRARVSGGVMDPFRPYSENRDNDVSRKIAEAGFRLEPGNISTPLEGDEGEYLIIKVIERIPPRKVLFADIRDKVRADYMYDAISGEEIQKWIQSLLKTSTIEVTREYNDIFSRKTRLESLKLFESELIKEEK